jgi:hypothetical protein
MPGRRESQEYTDRAFVAQVAAATATSSFSIFTAPTACRVRAVTVTPDVATTGNATNRKNLNVRNKGSAGAGTTLVAHLNLDAGVNLTAFDETNIPLETAGPVILAEGDVLALEVELVGTGVIVGSFQVNVDWEPL